MKLFDVKSKLTTFQIIIVCFAIVILIGTILLMLPVSARSGEPTSVDCALFTATSAVCVTGLIVRDTASYWSPFGQAVILILIQTGGIGVITIAAFIETMSGKKLSLLERNLVENSISAFQLQRRLRPDGNTQRGIFLPDCLQPECGCDSPDQPSDRVRWNRIPDMA